MPDISRRTVLASAAAPLAAYLPWPVAEQWRFEWSARPVLHTIEVKCVTRFPDGHTQTFFRPASTGNQQAPQDWDFQEHMRWLVYKRAIEMKRDIHHVWWQRRGMGNTAKDPRLGLQYRREMDAFSEDLSDVDLPEWLPHA